MKRDRKKPADSKQHIIDLLKDITKQHADRLRQLELEARVISVRRDR